MKNEDLSISRRGKLVVIEHEHYNIEYNLSKGTWNYSNNKGKTVLKNAITQISLDDETVLKTSDAGFREFNIDSIQKDAFGSYQTLRFSYQTEDTKKTAANNATDSGKVSKSTGSIKDGVRIHTFLTCYIEHPYILLKVSVENCNADPISLSNITLIDISTKQGSVQLGSHPSQYHLYLKIPPISPCASTHRKIYDGFQLNQDNTTQPCQDGILYDVENKNSFLFGFITADKWWARMQIGYQASKRKTQQGLTTWALYHDCENTTCQSDEEVFSEIGYLDFSDDISTSYDRYTERLATQNGELQKLTDDAKGVFTGHTEKQKSIAGWNITSDSTPEKLTVDTIAEQMKFVVKNPFLTSNHVERSDYINLESGWQKTPGYLALNPDCFPEGMASVVNQIHDLGFKAGIRIDPFCIERKSELLQKHPEVSLLTKDKEKNGQKTAKKGTPIEVHLPGRKKAYAILDASHPQAQKHIHQLMNQLIDEWGFDLIKIDLSSYTSGMMSVSHNIRWNDNSLTSTELYRQAVRLLTESASDTEKEAILAGYNIIESVSIGCFNVIFPLLRQKHVDSSESWHQQNGTKHRLSRYAGYLNTHNGMWQTVYGDLSVDEPRPVNEAIVELTAAALSGSPVFFANTPATLSKIRAELIGKVCPLTANEATVIDMYDETLPQIWHLPIKTEGETWHLLGVFNWKDQQDDIHINLDKVGLSPNKDYLVHDFWMRQYLGVVSKHVTLQNIIPRSAKLLCLREEQAVPQLLSTDMHYTQGSIEILSAGWDEHSQSFLLICQPPHEAEGSIFIHVPEDFLPVSVSAYGSEYKYTWDKPIYQIIFGATASLVHASIKFTQTSGGTQDNTVSK